MASTYRYLFLIVIGFFSWIFSSCDLEEEKKTAAEVLPSSMGARCEIMVVSRKSTWLGKPGERLRRTFMAPQSGLPQAEPWFDLIYLENKNFKGYLERNKALIILEEGPTNDFIWVKDKWAKPQNIAFFEYNDLDSLDQLIRKHWKEIFDTFRAEDLLRVAKLLEKVSQKKYTALKNPKYEIQLPKGFATIADKDNLKILFNRGKQSDQGIIIARRPAPEDFFAFNELEIYAWRDSITSRHVQASRENSYTLVDTLMPPVSRFLEFNGMLAIESRGVYRSVGDIMGGPFINYVLYDEKNKQFIMLDAFLLALGLDKRNLMLELEVMLKTLSEN